MTSIYESISSLARGREAQSHQPLDFQSAQKHVQKLCIGVAKLGVGIAGFIAVSHLMNQQPSSLAAAGVCTVALGGAMLLASKVSIFFLDAVKITTSIVLLHKGFLNLLVSPLISWVKGPVKELDAYLVTNAVCRFVGGMFSFSLAHNLAHAASLSLSHSVGKGRGRQAHLIDQGITVLISPIASIFTLILGY
ncbi:MAG TPA: hypothetical protein VFU89_00220 [Rhabdochlamydiaceae bacterium]|nr:hypothetical protein [Rhabdochlamydiaceae bacterium]